MNGFALRVVVALVLNAVAIAIASVMLDGVRITGLAFVLAVVIFTVASLVARPIVRSLVKEYRPALTFLVALVVTYLALLVTDLLSDGLDIEGIGTWVAATVIVWLATVVLELVSRVALRGQTADG